VKLRGIWLVVASLAAAALLPVAAIHALYLHLGHVHMDHSGGVGSEPRMQVQLALALVSVLPLAGVLWSALTWIRGSVRLARLTSPGSPVSHPRGTYRLIPIPTPTLFVAGITRPELYVSEGARTGMTASAFDAALLHERAHVAHRDPFAKLLVHLCRGGYGWIPGVRVALDAVELRMECDADDSALAAGTSRRDLFDAISGVATHGHVGTGLASEGVVYRLERLAGIDVAPPAPAVPRLSLAVLGVSAVPVTAHGALSMLCGIPLL
jgi:hypothetical protein